MKIQAPFRQSKNPSGKRGMYTFVYLGPRFLSLTGLWPEGCGIALRAMSMYGCSAALVGAL